MPLNNGAVNVFVSVAQYCDICAKLLYSSIFNLTDYGNLFKSHRDALKQAFSQPSLSFYAALAVIQEQSVAVESVVCCFPSSGCQSGTLMADAPSQAHGFLLISFEM